LIDNNDYGGDFDEQRKMTRRRKMKIGIILIIRGRILIMMTMIDAVECRESVLCDC